jgi:PAS domain S-box-containing protein
MNKFAAAILAASLTILPAHAKPKPAAQPDIPAGTYTMVQPADGGIGFFSFMSQRFLDICGLDREEARSDPFKAFACVHPEDHAEWVRKNAEVFASKQAFFGECRVVVDGTVKWIMAESRPRDLPDGTVVWEGVLVDITRQKRAEEELARIRDAERLKAFAGDRHIGQILARQMRREEDIDYLEQLMRESRHLEVRNAAQVQLRLLKKTLGRQP